MADGPTTIGAVVRLSASRPSTKDTDSGTGFPSLTFTEIGEVGNISAHERSWNKDSYQLTLRAQQDLAILVMPQMPAEPL